MKVTPLENKVLIKTIESTEPKGLIEIPETSKEKSQEAVVLALGKRRSKDGAELEPDIKIGDRVIAARYTGAEVKLGTEDYSIVGYDEIVCVLG